MKENISKHSWLLQRIRKKESDSCDPMNYSLNFSQPGSSVHGILQVRILEWVAISFSTESSQTGNWTRVSCIAGRWFTNWAMREALLVKLPPANLVCLRTLWRSLFWLVGIPFKFLLHLSITRHFKRCAQRQWSFMWFWEAQCIGKWLEKFTEKFLYC